MRTEIIGDATYYFDENGYAHRYDGPAIETPRIREWYTHGVRDRIDGPSVEIIGYQSYWYRNNVIHRDGGPAIEFADGSKSWFFNGKKVSEKNYWQLLRLKAFL